MRLARVNSIACLAAAVILLAAGGAMAIVIDTVPVGNPGNIGELSGTGAGGLGPDATVGAVSYNYNIGKYEVTAAQYTGFLNAVATTDTYGLYEGSNRMSVDCGITQSGSPGSYSYAVDPNYANRPVNWIQWGDAARFANWLHNGQPTGAQDLTTTEDGAYYLNGAMNDAALLLVTRESDWKWAIASEDEWYKAAYYNPNTGTYYDYATSNDSLPGTDQNDVSGNNANYVGGGGATTVGGEYQNSDSPYGTFDQSGNVHEWNEALLIYGGTDSRGFRGGAYSSSVPWGAPNRFGQAPTGGDNTIGFRVVQVYTIPEPTVMAALALGSMLILIRRRNVRG